jgi:hypothetical protein
MRQGRRREWMEFILSSIAEDKLSTMVQLLDGWHKHAIELIGDLVFSVLFIKA